MPLIINSNPCSCMCIITSSASLSSSHNPIKLELVQLYCAPLPPPPLSQPQPHASSQWSCTVSLLPFPPSRVHESPVLNHGNPILLSIKPLSTRPRLTPRPRHLPRPSRVDSAPHKHPIHHHPDGKETQHGRKGDAEGDERDVAPVLTCLMAIYDS